jgi:hypothetical protein
MKQTIRADFVNKKWKCKMGSITNAKILYSKSGLYEGKQNVWNGRLAYTLRRTQRASSHSIRNSFRKL